MKIAVFPKTCAIAGRPVMAAFIKSLQGEDFVICENHERPEADIVVMWSWLLGMYGRDAIYNHYKNTKTKFLILDLHCSIYKQTNGKLKVNTLSCVDKMKNPWHGIKVIQIDGSKALSTG